MFSLYNIVFDTIASVVVCVDFLGTQIASLVLFFKTGCDSGATFGASGRTRSSVWLTSVLGT